jgi:hypothetical protein
MFDRQHIKAAHRDKKLYPVPRQAAVRGSDLSSYEVTGGEENDGGERSETWDSWLHLSARSGKGDEN